MLKYIPILQPVCTYDITRPNAWAYSTSICIINLYDKIPHSIFYKSHCFYLILINSYHINQFGIDTHTYYINNSSEQKSSNSVGTTVSNSVLMTKVERKQQNEKVLILRIPIKSTFNVIY